MNDALLRGLAAGASLLAYAGLCAGIWHRERQRAAAAAADGAALAAGRDAAAPMLVVHASQTGQAEALAWQTAHALHAQGSPARVLSLNTLDAATLAAAPRAFFIASTYGEGDAPDGASVFVQRLMQAAAAPRLPGLRYALLALGDRRYAQFCAFGRRLDGWLQAQGARPLFPRIEADAGDPAALQSWLRALHPRAADTETAAAAPAEDRFQPWRLVERTRLNPGSEGGPVFELALAPPPGLAPHWEAGDLAQVQLPGDPGRPRDYSIASIARDGHVQLIVRLTRRPDGSPGLASGWLASGLAPGETLALRLRPQPGFRIAGNATRPLLLIGNGTGLAGLRAHLRQRAAAGTGAPACWLVFGERQAAHDFLCRDELQDWHARGVLARLDAVFSRDAPDTAEKRYVQHQLLAAADAVRDWITRDAAIYVCGSLQGMAAGVDDALRRILGASQLQELAAAGRYRRDLY